IKKYEKQDEMIKEILRKLYIENIDIIVKNHVELPIDLFEFLISNENILLKDKIVILTDNIDKFSKREIRNYIKMIGSKDYERIFSGRPKLEITETNRNLLKKLKSKELISYFREKNGFFRVGHRNLK
ncbi:MAG: hypothetical protein LKF66_07845, partial [Clostridium tyrobutyricum]|nr:hypothetical protein [Clostridium tyrobutyricum]